MRPFLALAALVLAHSGSAYAQTCTTQALLSVQKAKSSYAGGDKAAAKIWLERAYLECKTSSTVAQQISETYKLMGDELHAKLYADQAASLGGRPPILLKQPPASIMSGGDRSNDNSYVREKWALVIGVSEFKNPRYNLQFSAKDARDFAAVLTDPKVGRFRNDPEHLKLLTNEQATVEGIKTAINDIARDAKPDDLVAMYVSSHGTSKNMDIATDEGKSGYLVTYNTDVNNLYATAFPMDELKRDVDKRIRAKRVVLFMDTCYSGEATRDTQRGSKTMDIGIPDDSFARIAQGTGRVVIASSRDTERSWESDQLKNSYFTHFLMEAMKARDGLLTVSQIYTYLQRFVPATVLMEKKEPQHPVIHPEGQNINIVIGAAPQ